MAKGQFYILTGVIFIFFIYSLTVGVSYTAQNSDPFEDLKQNFITEANKAINSAIYEGNDPFFNLDSFSKEFMQYAKERGMEFRFIYILSYDGSLKIVNYLNNNVDIYYEDKLISNCNNGVCNPLIPNNLAELDWLPSLRLNFLDKSYFFEFSDSKNVELKVLFRGELRR